jgi:hypothetical protein
MQLTLLLENPNRQKGRSHFLSFGLMLLMGLFLLNVSECLAGPLYRVEFEGEINSGFGGLPPTEISGSYDFEVTPIDFLSDGDHVARYETSMQSATLQLNGASYSAVPGEIVVMNNVANDIGIRDSYSAVFFPNGLYENRFELIGAGLEFNQIVNQPGVLPSALVNFNLPVSVSDLAGFGSSDQRFAFLSFKDTTSGDLFSEHCEITRLTFTPVPEPSTLALSALAVGCFGAGAFRSRKAKKNGALSKHR